MRILAFILLLSAAWISAGAYAAHVIAPDPPGQLPTFLEVTEKAGIHWKRSFGDHALSNIVEGTGAGACVFDYNNDGYLDIYFVNARWTPEVNDNQGRDLIGKLRNALYRNNGDGTFTDVTEQAGLEGKGYGVGCSAADYDNDGHVDLLVLNYGSDELYHNNGNGTFTDVTAKSGLKGKYFSVSAPWLDYNNDGLLDVYIANYLEYDAGKFRAYYAAAGYPGPLSYKGQPDFLYRNNGDGTFTDVTKEAGVYNADGRGMSAVAVDLNNDGYLDLYVTNDAMEANYYENTGKGTFKERAAELGLAFGENGQGVSAMGPVFGDINRDGFLDIFVPALGYASLHVNVGYKYFEDRMAQSNLAVITGQYTGWGAAMFDYDNDGYPDIFIANGDAHHEYTQDPVMARNDGQGRFIDVARQSGAYFKDKYVSRGALYFDYDNDGYLDLLVIDLNGSPHLLHNDRGGGNNWLTVVPKIHGGKVAAIGARVTVTANGMSMIEDAIGVRGYLSQSDWRPHFGLGKAAKADVVEIRWPNGKVQTLRDVKANQILSVTQ